MLDTQQILTIIKSNKAILDAIKFKNITVYGVLLGGSRLFGLEVDHGGWESDFDLCIIIDPADYKKMKKIPEIYYNKARINDIRIHWYYLPVDFRDFYLDIGYCGLEFWISAILFDFNLNNFFIINDIDKVNYFINSVKESYNTLFSQFKLKYSGDPQLDPQNILSYLHKKSYYLIFISCLLDKQVKPNIEKIKKIKYLSYDYKTEEGKHNDLLLPDDLSTFILERYERLNFWLKA